MRMTELQTEIERLTGTLNKWSDLVELSTIYVRMEEKYPEEMTLKKTNTYWDRIKNSVKNSLTGIIDALGDLLIFIIDAIPTLVILGLLFLIGLRIYKKHIRKKKVLPPEEKKE
jgi:predicted PurR-regulated permease PerM